MYRQLRKVHQIAGLVVLAFLAMYVLSGMVLVHRSWFDESAPERTTRTVKPEYSGEDTVEGWEAFLRDDLDLRGQVRSRRTQRDGGLEITIARPGITHVAEISRDRTTVRITEERTSWPETAIAFHRLHGYGGAWAYTLWAAIYDLVSVALIVFALTGVYLWYKLTRRRWIGWLVLGVSCGYTVGSVLYLLYSR